MAIYLKEQAKKVAERLTDSEAGLTDRWTYSVIPAPREIGFYLVEVHDESGEFVSNW